MTASCVDCGKIFNQYRDANRVRCSACGHAKRYEDGARTNRTAALERDGRACQQCKAKTCLEVHHEMPIAYGGGNDVENLRTLCSKHHRLVHKRLRMERNIA